MLTKDLQIDQLAKLVKKRAATTSDPVIPPSSRLKRLYNKYQNNKEDKFGMGLYFGQLFEYFVTSLLIQATCDFQPVRWFIPARVTSRYLKPKQRRNRLAYNRFGEIILHFGSVPAAEFDGIMRLGRKILIVESKCNVYGGMKTIQKFMSRLDMFKAAYKRNIHLLLILPTEGTPFEGQEILHHHPKIRVLELPNFQRFRSNYEENKLSVNKKVFNKCKTKLKSPHQVFPQKIKFRQYQDQLLKAFNQVLQKKSSIQEFFEAHKEKIDLIGKIPIGKIAPDCDIEPFDSPLQRIAQYLNSKVECVLFMKFREPFVVPEVISCINEMQKGQLPQYRRMTFIQLHNKFSEGRKKVTKGTLSYRQANQVRSAPNVRTLNGDNIKELILAGNQLTEYWTQNSYLMQIQRELDQDN